MDGFNICNREVVLCGPEAHKNTEAHNKRPGKIQKKQFNADQQHRLLSVTVILTIIASGYSVFFTSNWGAFVSPSGPYPRLVHHEFSGPYGRREFAKLKKTAADGPTPVLLPRNQLQLPRRLPPKWKTRESTSTSKSALHHGDRPHDAFCIMGPVPVMQNAEIVVHKSHKNVIIIMKENGREWRTFH